MSLPIEALGWRKGKEAIALPCRRDSCHQIGSLAMLTTINKANRNIRREVAEAYQRETGLKPQVFASAAAEKAGEVLG